MFGKKCLTCNVRVGGVFGQKNYGTGAVYLCLQCAKKKDQVESEARAKRQDEQMRQEKGLGTVFSSYGDLRSHLNTQDWLTPEALLAIAKANGSICKLQAHSFECPDSRDLFEVTFWDMNHILGVKFTGLYELTQTHALAGEDTMTRWRKQGHVSNRTLLDFRLSKYENGFFRAKSTVDASELGKAICVRRERLGIWCDLNIGV